MSFRPYKFLVVAVLQEIDDETGEVVSELATEQPAAVFGIDGLRRFADGFEADLVARSNGSPDLVIASKIPTTPGE